MTPEVTGVAVVAAAYLLGSIPTAYIAGRLIRGIDLRTVGSGNLGATNVYRELGTAPALVVLAADMLKGAAPAWAGTTLLSPLIAPPEAAWWALACGCAAIAGHSRSVFLRFRGGGKGVATAAGVFLALTPLPLLGALGVFGVAVAATRMVSVGSILAALALPALEYRAVGAAPAFVASIAVAGFVVFTHRSNIARLMAGTEPRLGRRGGQS